MAALPGKNPRKVILLDSNFTIHSFSRSFSNMSSENGYVTSRLHNKDSDHAWKYHLIWPQWVPLKGIVCLGVGNEDEEWVLTTLHRPSLCLLLPVFLNISTNLLLSSAVSSVSMFSSSSLSFTFSMAETQSRLKKNEQTNMSINHWMITLVPWQWDPLMDDSNVRENTWKMCTWSTISTS